MFFLTLWVPATQFPNDLTLVKIFSHSADCRHVFFAMSFALRKFFKFQVVLFFDC